MHNLDFSERKKEMLVFFLLGVGVGFDEKIRRADICMLVLNVVLKLVLCSWKWMFKEKIITRRWWLKQLYILHSLITCYVIREMKKGEEERRLG